MNTKFAYKLKIKVNYDSYIQLCVEQERRFIQQFNEKRPAMMYIWTGMYLRQLIAK